MQISLAPADGASSPTFHLSLLGGFELTGPLGIVDLPSKKLAGLLAYLACTAPRPQSREKLSALFWGSHFDVQAKQNLRQALFRLRKVLGEDAIESDGEVVALNTAAILSDVSRFEAMVREGSRDALSAATDLYRGRLIDDVIVGEEGWSEWLTGERARLLELALDAMVRLGEQELATGRIEQALKAGQRAIALNNMREDAHRLIVQALAAMGHKSEALKHYQGLVALLRRELNTEPDAATRSLVAELRSTPSPSGPPAIERIAKPALPAGAELSLAGGPGREVDTERLAALSDSAAAGTAVSPDSSERRQLTIMACNIVDSMALSTRLDPEHMRDLVTAFHRAVDDVVSRFDGFVAQYLGDGVLVYFGYPAANEHDTEQAVRAGLAILDAVRALKADSEASLRARVGIATGLVVVGEQLGTSDIAAIGGTPNLAARLQAAAAPDEVVIAASTWRLVGRMFDCRALAAIESNGLPPLAAWKVDGENIATSRFDARRGAVMSPLMGRQEEIELLLRRWGQAEAGEGRVVLLSGEPGIGKSRIADRYVLDGPLLPLAIPTTLRASLVARLDRLASVKGVAQIGAAIGREFSHELISAVASLSPADLDAALERLTVSGLISRRGTPPIATYAFKHALVQDAAYATMLKSRRRQLHASIANVLVEQFPVLTETLPETVAHHFTEAGLASEAIAYWLKAGRLAHVRWALREGVKFFEQALEVLATLPESRSTLELGFDIRIELRQLVVQLGEFRRALEHLREAETLAERMNDDRRRGRVCAVMTGMHGGLGELDDGVASGTRALEIAGRLGDLRLRILATSFLAHVHFFRGEHAQVVTLTTDNLSALPADWGMETLGIAAPPSVYDRGYLILSLAELGRFAEAAEPTAEAIRLVAPALGAYAIGWAHLSDGTVHLLRGDWAQARSAFEHAIAAIRAGNLPLLLPLSIVFSAWSLAQLGEASEALSRLREGEQLVERQAAGGYVGNLGWLYPWLGRAALSLGRLDDARRLGERALEASPHQPGFAAHAHLLLGEVATHLDRFDAERGETHYRQALALAEPCGMRPLVAHCHLGLGKLYRRSGTRERAQKHFTTATTLYRAMDMPFWLEQAEAEMRQLR